MAHVLVGAFVAAVALTSCTGSTTGVGASSPTASDPATTTPAGIETRGWPTDAFDCRAVHSQPPKSDPTKFDSVTELLICVMNREPQSFSLSPSDQGFDKVMTALAAKDDNRPIPCPFTLHTSRTTTLGAVAQTSEGVYRVHIPYGACGWTQSELQDALKSAGIGGFPTPLVDGAGTK